MRVFPGGRLWGVQAAKEKSEARGTTSRRMAGCINWWGGKGEWVPSVSRGLLPWQSTVWTGLWGHLLLQVLDAACGASHGLEDSPHPLHGWLRISPSFLFFCLFLFLFNFPFVFIFQCLFSLCSVLSLFIFSSFSSIFFLCCFLFSFSFSLILTISLILSLVFIHSLFLSPTLYLCLSFSPYLSLSFRLSF